MAAKAKKRKMDPKLVSKVQHEIKYLAGKLKVSQASIRAARQLVGRSRKAVTDHIMQQKLIDATKKARKR